MYYINNNINNNISTSIYPADTVITSDAHIHGMCPWN